MSALPDPLIRLFLPFRADDPANPALAAVVVFAVAVLVGWSVSATVPVFEAHVSGTVTVDNPERPADVFCDGNDFESEILNGTPSACDEPRTVQKSLGARAASTASGLVVPFGLAVAFSWPVAAAVLWALTGASKASGSFRDVLAGTGWGFVPFLLPAAARPYLVERAARTFAFPGTLDGVAAAVRSILVGFGSEPLTALSLAALAWSAYVFAGVARRVRGVSRGRAVAAAVGPAILLGVASVVGNSLGPMPAQAVGYGVVLAALGAPFLVAPREVIEFNKQFELIGFRNTRSVEPEEWYVALHRFGGLAFVGLGYVLTGGPALLV
ncbi:YIP1 family protein [Halopelagius longus]|uniref:Yip1 domain-containing protein n=1 Tax=Halopelagius longus TaxID=1236180 RepID=A0A1H0Y1I8_9EURY|nr:YIP1 family protein [Halopelagius longus]RDI72226.1 hypothetical protein DWB78_11175 [Halopelagius longus]SDQ09037.1 Yip1 domain-containing protein [Halopelagius longus]